MPTTPTTPAPPAPTAPETDSTIRYRLGNTALIFLWLTGITIIGYGIASDAPWGVRISLLAAIGAPLFVRILYFMVRLLRKKPPVGDAARIVEGGPWQDERQSRLSDKAGHLAGAVAMVVPCMFAIFGAEVAAMTGLTITGMDDWMILGLGMANATLMTHTITFIIAARHYSRKG